MWRFLSCYAPLDAETFPAGILSAQDALDDGNAYGSLVNAAAGIK